MTDPSPAKAAGETPPETPPPVETFYEKPVWKRFYAFLLGPALVAAVAMAIFVIFSMMTRETENPQDLVRRLRAGGEHGRWQAAFALTRYIQPSVTAEGDRVTREDDREYQAKLDQVRILVPELLEIWNDPRLGDDEVRPYLALVFSYLGEPRVLPDMAAALRDENAKLVHHALVAITTIADRGSTGWETHRAEVTGGVIGASRREEPDIRATAVYCLGVLGGETAMARLAETVDDLSAGVRAHSAFALARHRHLGGESVIAEILDQGPIMGELGPEPAKRQEFFLNAVRSAGMVRSPKLDERLSRIAESAENLAVRNAAKQILMEKKAGVDEG